MKPMVNFLRFKSPIQPLPMLNYCEEITTPVNASLDIYGNNMRL